MLPLFNFIIKDYDRKLIISENLIKEVFIHIASNGNVYYDGDKITSVPVSWIKSDYISQYLKHKKYKELCYAYGYAKDYANRRISCIENALQHYREYVTQKLRVAQIQLPVSERFIDHKTEHYDISFVRQLIFDDLYRELRGLNGGNKLRIEGSALVAVGDGSVSCDFNTWVEQLYWGGKAFAVGDTRSLEYLKSVIQKIEKDETLCNIIRCIQAERLLLVNNIWLKRFNDERERIIKQVTLKRKPLEGV